MRTLALLAVALALPGCAVSVAWTIGPASSAGPETIASGEHLDPEALEALGEAAGSAVRGALLP